LGRHKSTVHFRIVRHELKKGEIFEPAHFYEGLARLHAARDAVAHVLDMEDSPTAPHAGQLRVLKALTLLVDPEPVR
jgi:hypothetical protein